MARLSIQEVSLGEASAVSQVELLSLSRPHPTGLGEADINQRTLIVSSSKLTSQFTIHLYSYQLINRQFFKMGGGGLGNMFGGMDVDSDDEGHSFFSGGMPGGMPRGSQFSKSRRGSFNSTPETPRESHEITRPLKVSLEELYEGVTKRLKVSRKLSNGQGEEKVLEIKVLPGWKSGTKIRFPRAGNENAAGETQDLVFVVEEKPHPRIARDGSDLIVKERIPLVDALVNSGGTRQVEHLDGRKLTVSLPSNVIKPGSESRIPGEGMPLRKGGTVQNKGDFIVRWEVDFPDRLTSSQKEGIRKILG